MVDEGLFEVSTIHTGRAGRPRKRVRPTALGLEYLRTYDALKLKELKSRRVDLSRAAADAEYAQRLADRGVSSYDLFLELNALASNPRRPAV